MGTRLVYVLHILAHIHRVTYIQTSRTSNEKGQVGNGDGKAGMVVSETSSRLALGLREGARELRCGSVIGSGPVGSVPSELSF